MSTHRQLISYIAPAAPATRRPATGAEPRMRPAIGFTPKWYCQHLDIDFGERWHTEPDYRRATVRAMRAELRSRFPGTCVGGIEHSDASLDLLTGTYGTCLVAAIYGVPIVYAKDNWPNCGHRYLTDDQIDRLEPPSLERNPPFRQLLSQLDWIAESEGRVEGYINWQGVLNNAQRIRGQQLFLDMVQSPERARRIFDCVCRTMIEAAQRLHSRQRQTGFHVGFFTISNCLVNMVSPQQYVELLQPFDRRLAETFGRIGIHNCAWNADPYVEAYSEIPHVAYIDMGIESDLGRARDYFPCARRAVMYTPMDLARRSLAELRADFERIARDYAPCDIVLADIEAGTPDDRIRYVVELCRDLSEQR